ncbi:MAG: hypothetical protein CL942_15290 [Desulfovibrio sp.]|nr:HAMP domain-containing sensor histidine kinase [Pseudodesulfovibrio profundus]MBC18402.1 hypothetical protein [Desulfovibrio sp.]|tara:strand:+ start:14631 stop:15806 length:1176 start_codon:yes stop_codon:yes gene_type:complete
MTIQSTLSIVFIALGASIMLFNLFYYRRTLTSIQKQTTDIPNRICTMIKAHLLFMGFFFLSYLYVLYIFSVSDIPGSLLVSLIFFFGAIFVLVGIHIQNRLFANLETNRLNLINSNNRLQFEQEQLIELNRQLKTEIEGRIAAQESDQLKTDFLAKVSHELRTPLTSIYGFAQLLNKQVLALDPDNGNFEAKQKQLQDNLEIVSIECRRLTRLINNVLDLEKIESNQVIWNNQKVSIHEIVQESYAAVEGLWVNTEKIRFTTSIPNDLPLINVDKDLFIQVFVNLISNAVKFMDQGVIDLTTHQNDDEIFISLSDEGVGIPPEHISSVFDKYFFKKSMNPMGGKKIGTGLGLPICKEIVEHYDGEITVESTLGQGSTFTIRLPKSVVIKKD